MPRGTYLHLETGLSETFQCAPGPGGWRYVGTRADGLRLDLAVDGRWQPARLELRTAGWLLRGGRTGAELLWLRAPATGAPLDDPAAASEHTARALGFTGDSPGFLVAVARSLRLTPGASALVRLVSITGPALAARTIDQRWTLREVTTHETETVPLPVERYEVAWLDTGLVDEVHLAGDTVLAAPGIELTALESPPTLGAPG